MALPQPIEPKDPTAPASKLSNGELLERVLIRGDLSKLTATEKAGYVRRICEHVGIDPITQPFEIINLQGKHVLYAKKDATEQLRKKYGISVIDMRQEELSGVYIVIVKVRDRTGREDMARGAVNIAGLKGQDLANALMKAETKAKRRATLSISGLGILDETEVDDIQANKRKSSYAAKKDGTDATFNEMRKHIQSATSIEYMGQIRDNYADEWANMPAAWDKILKQEFADQWEVLGGDMNEVEQVEDVM